MARTDYYVILEVKRSDDHDTIKMSYRRLARRYHPDQNPGDRHAEDRFKSVVEAWEVLGDPARRRQYDLFGRAAPSGHMPPPDFEQVAVMREFLRQSARAAKERILRAKGKDLRLQVELSLLEALRGGTRVVDMPRIDHTGAPVVRRLEFDIPPGVVHGQTLRWKGQGAPGRYGGENGDFLVVIRVKPHDIFYFEDKQLHLALHLLPREERGGSPIEVPTPWGPRTLALPADVQHRALIEMPYVGGLNRTGDRNSLFVRVYTLHDAASDEEQAEHHRARAVFDAYLSELQRGGRA